MVFERQDHAALLGFGDALFNAFDAPFEPFILGMTWENRLDASRLHQVIKIFNRIPTTRIKANTGYPQLVGNLDTFMGMLNVFLSLRWIGLNEILVDGHAHQGDTVTKRMPLEFAQVTSMLRGQWLLFRQIHLAVKKVDP